MSRKTPGEIIRDKLKEIGKSQRDFSIAIEVSEATISDWCRDIKKPNRDNLAPAAKFLKMSVESFMRIF